MRRPRLHRPEQAADCLGATLFASSVVTLTELDAYDRDIELSDVR
jgi:hypothetical protein